MESGDTIRSYDMYMAAYGILRPFGKGFEDIRWQTQQTPA
jgi:hypothetical protein